MQRAAHRVVACSRNQPPHILTYCIVEELRFLRQVADRVAPRGSDIRGERPVVNVDRPTRGREQPERKIGGGTFPRTRGAYQRSDAADRYLERRLVQCVALLAGVAIGHVDEPQRPGEWNGVRASIRLRLTRALELRQYCFDVSQRGHVAVHEDEGTLERRQSPEQACVHEQQDEQRRRGKL